MGLRDEISSSPVSVAGSTLASRNIGGVTSTYSGRALDRLREHRGAIRDVLTKYGASNPRLFGSIAQGTAGPDSRLSRLSGIRLELEELLNMPVDVACEDLLNDRVSESARSQAIAL